MKINTENKELGNVGKIIDFLIVKLDNGTIIEVGGIKHIDTVCTSEVKYNIILIKDIDTKVEHKVLLDDSNYDVLMEDILK